MFPTQERNHLETTCEIQNKKIVKLERNLSHVCTTPSVQCMKVDTCAHSLVSPTSSVRSFVRGSWPAGTLLVVCLPSSENAGEQNHASGSGQPEKWSEGE